MNDPVNESTIAKPVAEESITEPAQFDKLSNREALEKAIGEKREVKPVTERASETSTPSKPEVQADIEAPAGFSKEGVKAWQDKDITGIQKEYRRIYDSRTQEISRAQTEEKKAREEARLAKEEGKTWRDLGEKIKPYIAARGEEGVTPEKAMMEALSLIDAFRKADPATAKAELKRLGIDLDKASGSPAVATVPPEVKAQLDTLQKAHDESIKEREEQRFQTFANTFTQIFDTLTSQKTRTGDSVFPDLLDNSEKGMQFAKELGSLTQDQRFQQGVLRRFPDADLTTVVREAYKYLGGKVSGEPVKVSTSNQQHIDKSRRAAASTPAKAVSRNDSSNLVGKLSNRAALARALDESREH